MFTNILISTFSPFPTISLAVPLTSDISDVKFLLRERYPTLPLESLYLSSHASLLPSDSIPVSELAGIEEPFLNLRLSPRLPGGKGGFGSQLRAAGGRMSSQKTSNNDSCRDLSGRRLSTIKEAKRLAEYLASEPERVAAKAEAQKAKLDALEKKLGIVPGASSGSSSDESSMLAGKKHRFDDTEYLEQSRELNEGVKSAVAAALLKKRNKKPKLTHEDSPSSAKPQSVAPAKPLVEPPVAPSQPVDAIGA